MDYEDYVRNESEIKEKMGKLKKDLKVCKHSFSRDSNLTTTTSVHTYMSPSVRLQTLKLTINCH